MKKEIPILFSTDMVLAILAGRKTMTRRIINPQPIVDQDSGYTFDGKHKKQYDIHNWQDQFIDDFSRWMPGDLLWVRETFSFALFADGERYLYKATNDQWRDYRGNSSKWKPSIHMPKEAARIWLEVTDIRVELQIKVDSFMRP
jgi:hypothetical protein